MKRKKVVQKYLMVKSDSTEAEVEERNLTAPLWTHMFSIHGGFSSTFTITISGSIPPLQDSYPCVGDPFPVHFLPPTHLLATLMLLCVTNDTTGGQSRFWKRKKWNGNLWGLLCVKLKCLVRRGPNSWLEWDFRKTWAFCKSTLFLSWSVNQALAG